MGISQPDTPAAQVWGLLAGKSQIPQGTPNSVQLAWATSNLELLPISKSTLEDLWLAFGHNQIIQLDNSLCLTKVVYTPNKGKSSKLPSRKSFQKRHTMLWIKPRCEGTAPRQDHLQLIFTPPESTGIQEGHSSICGAHHCQQGTVAECLPSVLVLDVFDVFKEGVPSPHQSHQ